MTAAARGRRSISLSLDSVEQLLRVGTAFFDEQQPKEPLLLPYTIANCLVRHESSVLSRLRKRLAEKFDQPVDHPFFRERYLPGEDSNAALLRLFKQRQWMVSLTDEQTIDSMTRRSQR